MGQDFVLYLGAVARGALHAFEPGHGKTIIAAYMIGTRGRAIEGPFHGLCFSTSGRYCFCWELLSKGSIVCAGKMFYGVYFLCHFEAEELIVVQR